MRFLHYFVIAILLSSGVVLICSTIEFKMAEQYFENTRNGLVCNKPGSSCPFPDFEDPMFHGIVALGVFFFGVFLTLFKDRVRLTIRLVGMVSITTGILALVSGILAYVDDYSRLVVIMQHCSNSPCMYPMIFANIQFVQFYGTFGAILIILGTVFLAIFRGMK